MVCKCSDKDQCWVSRPHPDPVASPGHCLNCAPQFPFPFAAELVAFAGWRTQTRGTRKRRNESWNSFSTSENGLPLSRAILLQLHPRVQLILGGAQASGLLLITTSGAAIYPVRTFAKTMVNTVNAPKPISRKPSCFAVTA